MTESVNREEHYRIEVSGWGFDNDFFVERADLIWDPSNGKRVLLHHCPPEGGIVFIRLLLQDRMGETLPVAYQVACVQPMDCNGRSEVRLRQMRRRTKVSQMDGFASYVEEDCGRTCEPGQTREQLEHEEILQ
jgi:hypothetical protein